MLRLTEGMVSLFKVSFCAWKKLKPLAPFVSLDLDMATLMMLPFNPSLINGKTSTETSIEEDGGGLTLMLHSQKFRLFCSSDMETCPSASWHSTARTSLRNQFAFRVCAYYYVPLKVKLTRRMTDCHILLVSLKCIQTLKKEPSASREIAQSSGFLRKCQRQGRSDFSEQNKRFYFFPLLHFNKGAQRWCWRRASEELCESCDRSLKKKWKHCIFFSIHVLKELPWQFYSFNAIVRS